MTDESETRVELVNELLGAWTHAHEEDEGDLRMYRPRGYPLPPARGRSGFELLPGGRARLLSPGRGDGGAMEEVSWSLAQRNTLRFEGPEGKPRLQLVIVSVTPESLRARILR